VWLLLCSSDDRAALWAATRLEARGVHPLVVLTPELLHCALRWEHRLGHGGPPSVRFALADGREIEGGAIRGVLNRIAALPPHLVERSAPGDRAYALQEWTAFFTSWLSSLPVPVFNLPTAQGLCGSWRHPSEWHWLAAQAGLAIRPYRLCHDTAAPTTRHPSLVTRHSATGAVEGAGGRPRTAIACVLDGALIDDGTFGGTLPDDARQACGRLGLLSKTRLIEVELEEATWRFVAASPRPDLARGGAALVAALADALGGVA
jgi:hypothetical protein